MSNIISLTDAAIARIKSFLQQNPMSVLRIAVEKAGCSGWQYVVNVVPQSKPGDEKVKIQDLEIYVDGESSKFLKGSQLDWVKKGLNWQWEFNNPNVKNSCGCGESFTVKDK